MQPNIYLIGMPGSGKSTVGRALANLLDREFVDVDLQVIARTGVPIATIFDLEGEAGFRQREARELSILSALRGAVISTGGGSILLEENRKLLRETGRVVYLRASVPFLLERTSKDQSRPLLQGENKRLTLESMLTARGPLYEATADIVIDPSRRTSKAAAAEIARLLGNSVPDQTDIQADIGPTSRGFRP
jgi:shikimate kinase